jgi:hypothetical protein
MTSFAEELETARLQGKPFVALRPDHTGALDDVVVTGVTMFRAEDMGDEQWWLCCYLTNGDRITWTVGTAGGLETVEYPEGVVYESGSDRAHA